MAIDPASYRSGWAFSAEVDNVMVYGEMNIRSKDLSIRLVKIYEEWCELLDFHKPDLIASESQFSGQLNRKTGQILSMVRGVITLAAAQRSIPMVMYPPTKVKLLMTGTGKADKSAMMAAAKEKFHIPVDITDNEGDALSILYITLEEGCQS